MITGPSGGGKSSALAQIARAAPGGCSVQRVTFPAEASIIDHVAPWAELPEAIGYLTICGLGQAPLWVRVFDELSEGEKFRARLARAVAMHCRCDVPGPLLCDEFGTNLHRRLARAISFNLRKLATRFRLSIVVACVHDDIIADLQPDVILRLAEGRRWEVEERVVGASAVFSLRHGLHIERGGKRDYQAFASMHYRAADELGFVDKVFVLRDPNEADRNSLLGIVVYSHSPLELSLRNQATKGRFSGDPERLNHSMRILRRLVIHPDVRGCGLGHYLVRKTLPLVGTEYVECLAAMGEFNPVFEKAGMKRIGQYELPAARKVAMEALGSMGVDPFGSDFALHVARRPGVRTIVATVVYRWYAGTTGGGRARVERQSPEFLAQAFRGLIATRPVYYLWRRPGHGKSKIESHSIRVPPFPCRKRRRDPEVPPVCHRHAAEETTQPAPTERRHDPRYRSTKNGRTK